MEELSKLAAEQAAQRLLGSTLERRIDNQVIRVRIVETESYDQTDPASHSYNGKTARTAPMFGPAGFAYVYFTYGMHYCFNIVVGQPGFGSGVLVRAVEPIDGQEKMRELRSRYRKPGQAQLAGIELSNGPAKLCQALAITKQLNGHNLSQDPLKLILDQGIPGKIKAAERVGISKAREKLWRFYLQGNPYVSR